MARSPTRRTVLRCGAAVGSLAVAGCIGGGTMTVVDSSLEPSAIHRGDRVRARVRLRNEANELWEAPMELTLDGRAVDHRSVRLAPGEETTETFEAYVDRPGEYDVAVDGTRIGDLEVREAWHQFGIGPGNGGGSTSSGPDDASQSWSVDFPTGISGGPAVVDGTSFVGIGNPYGVDGSGGLAAIDADTGELRWREPLSGAVHGTPAVADGLVVAGTTDGGLRNVGPSATVPGHVVARDAAEGIEQWSRSVEAAVVGSPVVSRGVVYAATLSGLVVALSLVDGEEIWTERVEGTVYTGPSVDEDAVYVPTVEGTLHALATEDGAERWSRQIGGPVRNAPSVADQLEGDGRVVYVGTLGQTLGGTGALVALDASTGDERWRESAGVTSSVAVAGDALVASVGVSTWAFERADGSVRWRGPDATAGTAGGPPAVADGVAYAGAGRVNAGLCYALDVETGEQRWSVDTQAPPRAPAVHDGGFYARTAFGTLSGFH